MMTWLLTEALVRRGAEVTLFATANSRTSARLHATFDEGYVRARVVDSNGKVAWTQPVFVAGAREKGNSSRFLP